MSAAAPARSRRFTPFWDAVSIVRLGELGVRATPILARMLLAHDGAIALVAHGDRFATVEEGAGHVDQVVVYRRGLAGWELEARLPRGVERDLEVEPVPVARVEPQVEDGHVAHLDRGRPDAEALDRELVHALLEAGGGRELAVMREPDQS